MEQNQQNPKVLSLGCLDAYPTCEDSFEQFPMLRSYRAVAANGVRMSVLTCRKSKSRSTKFVCGEFSVWLLPYSKGPTDFLPFLKSPLLVLKQVWKFVGSCDIVLLRVPHTLALLVHFICKLRGKRIITHVKGSWSDGIDADLPLKKRIVLNFLNIFVEGYHAILRRRPFLTTGPYTGDKNATISMFMSGYTRRVSEVKDVCEAVASRRSKNFMVVCRLTHAKGVDLLLQAIPKDSSDIYKIVGSGPELTTLKKMAKSLGLACVEFCGELTPSEIEEKYNWADILIIPSRTEGIPKVLLEALNAGCRIITTRVGAIPALYNAEEYVTFVNASDIQGLRNALLTAQPADTRITGLPEEWIKNYDIFSHINALAHRSRT